MGNDVPRSTLIRTDAVASSEKRPTWGGCLTTSRSANCSAPRVAVAREGICNENWLMLLVPVIIDWRGDFAGKDCSVNDSDAFPVPSVISGPMAVVLDWPGTGFASQAVDSVLESAVLARCAASSAFMFLSVTGQFMRWWAPLHLWHPFHLQSPAPCCRKHTRQCPHWSINSVRRRAGVSKNLGHLEIQWSCLHIRHCARSRCGF